MQMRSSRQLACQVRMLSEILACIVIPCPLPPSLPSRSVDNALVHADALSPARLGGAVPLPVFV